MRTDIHAPASPDFDPEAYDCCGVFDNDPDMPQGPYNPRAEAVKMLREQGYKIGMYNAFQCGHCGAHIRYCALMVHKAAGEYIYVGEDCLQNRFEALTKTEFQTLRKAAALNKERVAMKTKIADAIEANPILAWLTYPQAIADMGYFLNDVAWKFMKYGDLTVNQIAAVEKCFAFELIKAQKALEAEAKKAEMIELGNVAPEGRIEMTGEIITAKMQDGNYGTEYKMLVLAPEGWKLWATLPKNVLQNYWDNAEGGLLEFFKGKMINMTVTVTPKKDDPTFAWGTRPAKAVLL